MNLILIHDLILSAIIGYMLYIKVLHIVRAKAVALLLMESKVKLTKYHED